MRHYNSIVTISDIKAPDGLVFSLPITRLELTVRAYNTLVRTDICYVGELIEKTEEQLLDQQNFGRVSLDHLKGVLADRGLTLNTLIEGRPKNNEVFRIILHGGEKSAVAAEERKPLKFTRSNLSHSSGDAALFREVADLLLTRPDFRPKLTALVREHRAALKPTPG